MARKNNTNTQQPAANSNQLKLEKGVTTGVQLHEMPVEAGIGEIIIYNPNDSIQLEVRMEHESVWLSQSQMGTLFGVDRTVIVKHIKNVYECGELDVRATCAKIARVQKEGGRSVARAQKYSNLDMILSVGYRVNSLNATYFRKWASSVLREYLIRGYAINPRLEQLERRVTKTEEKIDNYVDETVLTMLDKREAGVAATIYTQKISAQFQLDLTKHNAQYPAIDVKRFTKSHDRFLILDNQVYLIGASLKDLGKKWFAVSLMSETDPEVLLSRLNTCQ